MLTGVCATPVLSAQHRGSIVSDLLLCTRNGANLGVQEKTDTACGVGWILPEGCDLLSVPGMKVHVVGQPKTSGECQLYCRQAKLW